MIQQRSNSRVITILIHVLAWSVFGIAAFFRQPLWYGEDISARLWLTQFTTLALLIAAFYVNSFILVPRLLLNNRTVIYLLVILAMVGSIIVINAWVESALSTIHRDFSLQEWKPPPLRFPAARRVNTLTVIICALVIVIGTSMTVIQKWQRDRQEREQVEKDKLNTELSYLKAQINPHFFFNTLNNIYALTQTDAQMAGKAVHQLSRMMRYLLYDTQQSQTMMTQEIDFIRDYISLMQLRLTDAVKVDLQISPGMRDIQMAPMILLPFVENAFKHGVSTTEESYIRISVGRYEDKLDLKVSNSIVHQHGTTLDANPGIGLINTRRRLELLYPGKYKLETGSNNGIYTVHLTIDLK